MRKYNVTGMSCAACSTRVERAVSGLDGVSACAVNLLTGSMSVEGNATDDEIIGAVVAAGYGASQMSEASRPSNDDKEEAQRGEIKKLKVRFFSSLAILIALMYVSMGYAMWGFPLPEYFESNPVTVGLIQMLLPIHSPISS